jgi:hypothetical protein
MLSVNTRGNDVQPDGSDWLKIIQKKFMLELIERNRRNNITSLRAEDGRLVFDHQEMAGLLWTCYKQRMGSTVGIQFR